MNSETPNPSLIWNSESKSFNKLPAMLQKNRPRKMFALLLEDLATRNTRPKTVEFERINPAERIQISSDTSINQIIHYW
jgi:hypothetical protein